MPKFLIPLLLLCSATLIAQSETLAPGMRLHPEVRVAELNFGAIAETLSAAVPNGSGYVIYSGTTANALMATPISGDGRPDLQARKSIGHPGVVAVSAGRPLLFWNEKGSIFASRLDVDGRPVAPVSVANGYSIQQVACDDSGCLISFMTGIPAYVVATDSDGRPLGTPIELPEYYAGYSNVSSITPDPNGFALLRFGGVRAAPRVVRVDRGGRVVYDSVLPFATIGQIVWSGDHDVLITNSQINGQWFVSATDITATGTLGQPRPLAATAALYTPIDVEPRGQGFLLAIRDGKDGQHISLFNVDSMVTTAVRAGGIDLPAQYTLVRTFSTGSSTIAVLQSGGALFTLGIDPNTAPSLLSYGPLTQQAQGVIAVGSDSLVAWSERDFAAYKETLRVARINRDGVVLNRTELGASYTTSLIPMASVGTDVLALWYDSDLGRSIGGIVHANGGIDWVDLGGTFEGRTIIATPDDWIVMARSQTGGTNAIRVSRSGMTYPAVSIAEDTLFNAATDGNTILVLTANQTIVLSFDLKVERRITRFLQYPGGLAFGGDSYLYADTSRLIRLDRNGEILSSASFSVSGSFTFSVSGSFNGSPAVVATSRGWLIVSRSTITPVLPANPPVIGATAATADVEAIALHGDDNFGMLFSRSVEAGRFTSTALFFRRLELVDTPRRRAVVTR